MQAVAAGTAYFAIVFAAAFCIGVLRTLLVAPHLGPLLAVACELPLIHLARYAGEAPEALGLAGQLGYALMPWLQSRRRRRP